MEKNQRKKPNFTLPILFALSLLLNYGQFSGWVTIQNPKKSEEYQKIAFENGRQSGQINSLAVIMDDVR